MKTITFQHVKTTKAYYRLQEVHPETGEILAKGDPQATFNFGCIYLQKDHFQIEPHRIEINVQAFYEKD